MFSICYLHAASAGPVICYLEFSHYTQCNPSQSYTFVPHASLIFEALNCQQICDCQVRNPAVLIEDYLPQHVIVMHSGHCNTGFMQASFDTGAVQEHIQLFFSDSKAPLLVGTLSPVGILQHRLGDGCIKCIHRGRWLRCMQLGMCRLNASCRCT